jgi:hypothetical protein
MTMATLALVMICMGILLALIIDHDLNSGRV